MGFCKTEDALSDANKAFVLESNVLVPGCACAFAGSPELPNLNGPFNAELFPSVIEVEFP